MPAKIFCWARVKAPKVSADECRKFRRFINNSLNVPTVPEVISTKVYKGSMVHEFAGLK
jgi:hypothetical protein